MLLKHICLENGLHDVVQNVYDVLHAKHTTYTHNLHTQPTHTTYTHNLHVRIKVLLRRYLTMQLCTECASMEGCKSS